MDNNEYLNGLIADLEKHGVQPAVPEYTVKTRMPDDEDLRIILDMEKETGFKYSDEQKNILKHRGNACILACAGSGKTSTSVHLIAKRILTGEIADTSKILYSTFSKSGATEMKTRLEALLNKLGMNRTIQVRTLHSFFLQVVRYMGVTYDIIKESQRAKFVREACKEADFEVKDDDLLLVDSLLSYQVNNMLSDAKTVASCVNTLTDLTDDIYAQIRTGYSNKKAAASLMDYDDMQMYMYSWLVNYGRQTDERYYSIYRQVKDYCDVNWNDYYIDEAQDVSKMQFAILKALLTDEKDHSKLVKNLVFIGDDDQAIYQWRGSDPSIILSIGPMFDMRTFVLSTNYRCMNEVVDFAVRGIKCNNSRYPKGMNAYADGGEVKILLSDKEDLCSLSKHALAHIKWLISNGESKKSIAVLARNNFHLAILNTMLLKEGIFCTISDDMKLTKSSMYKDMKYLIEMCNDTWKTEITSSMLWRLCKFMKFSTARAFADFQNNSNLSLRDTLGYLLQYILNKDVGFSKKVSISIQALERVRYFAETMSSQTASSLEIVYKAITSDDKVDCMLVLTHLYLDTTAFMYASEDKQRSIRGIANYFYEMVKNDGIEELKTFLRTVEQFESGSVGTMGEKVTLSTIHGAKGREWKNVIMFASDNVTSPSFDGIYGMVNENIPLSDIYKHIDEERRLYYVGNTRAKESLLLITSKFPSMFILESVGIITSDCNRRIYDTAVDRKLAEQYVPYIDKVIADTDSKYYYDISKHTVWH